MSTRFAPGAYVTNRVRMCEVIACTANYGLDPGPMMALRDVRTGCVSVATPAGWTVAQDAPRCPDYPPS